MNYLKIRYSDGRYLCDLEEHATLGKFAAESEAKMRPPWAETSFSFRFSGLPPVEVYDDYIASL